MLKSCLPVKPDVSAQWPARLQAALANVPFIERVDVHQDLRVARDEVDGKADVVVSGADSWTLLSEVKSSGQPRHARDAAARLNRAARAYPGHVYSVVVAPFLSPDSQDLLREEGLGWLDMAGNSRLSFGGIHIEQDKT